MAKKSTSGTQANLPGVAPIFSKVIINDAFSEPEQHLNLLRTVASEPELLEGRRPSGYYRPDPLGAETFEELVAVNRLRDRLRAWREGDYVGATRVTQALLRQWNRAEQVNRRKFFCQREAAEAIIWLTEGPEHERNNLAFPSPDPFTRYCCKLATGAGKTTVMAMLIAWTVLNRLTSPRDPRFTDAVLVVCPNLTVRERLQELRPSHPENTYKAMELLPETTDFAQMLTKARIDIVNWHKLAVSDDTGTRGVLQRGEETDGAFSKRVLTELGDARNIMVLNDEAHHAWRVNPLGAAVITKEEALELDDADEFERTATIWVEGLDRINRARGVRLCVDMSATPYFTALSKYPDGQPFPWVVSDFGLADAVECGIVKIPRVPKGDDSGESEPKYLHLWEHVKDKLSAKALGGQPDETELMKTLLGAEGAMRALAWHWSKTFTTWQEQKSPVPPCMIVVCNNTATAGFLEKFIASGDLDGEFQNDDEHEHTLRIDSSALRKAEGGAGGAAEQALREKVSTVGKVGRPGGKIRCVISVAMLSEGWDARNVTQILGLRAFSSRLLCEQVIGRGLRRADYTDLSKPEYVDIYGVPFSLIPVEREKGATRNLEPVKPVKAQPEREEYEITFPRIVGYRPETTVNMNIDESKLEPLIFDPSDEPSLVVMGEGLSYYGTGGQLQPLAAGETLHVEDVLAREQTVAFVVAREICDQLPEHHARFLFPRALSVAQDYIENHVVTNGLPRRFVALTKYQKEIVERILTAVTTATGETIHRPVQSVFSPEGSTKSVDFATRKPAFPFVKSHVDHVVCDPQHADADPEELWERRAAAALDAHPKVLRFVKIDHLGFSIPYRYQSGDVSYIPDFLAVIECDDGQETTLILEVKGWLHDQVAAKNASAQKWVDAVNAEGAWGRWAFAIVYGPDEVKRVVDLVQTTTHSGVVRVPRKVVEALA